MLFGIRSSDKVLGQIQLIDLARSIVCPSLHTGILYGLKPEIARLMLINRNMVG